MGRDQMDYARMVEDALRDVVRKALIQVSENGLPGEHYFYITFRTDQPGVEMADYLRERYPQEMTIVLQHQFWGLEVEEEAFSVLLSFNKVHERLRVPLRTLVGFSDPTAQFGLQFTVLEDEDGVDSAAPPEGSKALGPAATPGLPAPAGGPSPGRTDIAGDMLPDLAAGEGEAGPPAGEGEDGAPQDNVVTLDAFRKKQGQKD
ncbi:SspB family protein [Marinibaculum pumilum]|uniref:SspB family protein n=1 Tax=Marinibaculum pumilum TaxID=1766165 RepID=A0ABV7KZU7_9PROT